MFPTTRAACTDRCILRCSFQLPAGSAASMLSSTRVLARGVHRQSRLFSKLSARRHVDEFEENTKALTVLKYPGLRALHLTQPERGNVITESMLTTIKDKLTLYAGLPTVTAIVFSSSSPDFFSSGLETRLLDEKSRRKQLLATANETSALLKATDRETIALVNGEVDSVVFGVLATAKFRVGTETTKFQVTDLRDGRLPLGGGLAHHLIKSSEHGLALARYLALSGRSLTAHDLYVLGLLTHVVQQDSPEDTLGIGLGHSFSEDDDFKAIQKTVVERESVQELLDSMNIYMGKADLPYNEDEKGDGASSDSDFPEPETREREEIEEEMIREFKKSKKGRKAKHAKKFHLTARMKEMIEEEWAREEEHRADWGKLMAAHRRAREGKLDVLSHPVWDRVMLIPTQPTAEEEFFKTDEAKARAEDLEDVINEVAQCFRADSAAECRRLVEAAALTSQGPRVGDWVGENWAVRALRHWDSLPPAAVEQWFAFTKQAAAAQSIEHVYRMEEEAV